MDFQLRSNSTLRAALGDVSAALLEDSLATLTTILPHVETLGWKVESRPGDSYARFSGAERRELQLSVGIKVDDQAWTIRGTLRRRRMPHGVGAIPRTVDLREKDLAYGAVLEPRRKGRIQAAEGSRTKAAIGSSNYGLAVKISSDGDITVYVGGKELIRI